LFRFDIFIVQCLRGYFFPDTVYKRIRARYPASFTAILFSTKIVLTA